MTARRAAIVVALLGAPGIAGAELLPRDPIPRSLRMRTRVAASQPATPTPRAPIPMPIAPTVSVDGSLAEPTEDIGGLRDVRQKVSFSVNLGYQVDGARPSGRASLGGTNPVPDRDYSTLRSYGFGEAFLSTRGLGVSSLETYFALRFQAARPVVTTSDPPDPHDVAVPSPIATWFERTGFEFRTGWVEAKDFLPQRLGLEHLRVRAGNQFVYGPWILHIDGLHATYEGPTLTAALYTGARHSDYTRDQSPRRPIATGASLRLDLRGISSIPIAIAGEYMGLTRSDETGESAVNTELGQIDWRPRRDVVVIGSIRGVNAALASQRVEVRTRYKQVTNFVFDITRRLAADWRWDPSLVSRPTSMREVDTEAKRYLDLGPVLPQLIASARAGTLIRENIDLLARVALATDLVTGDAPVNTFSSPYFELAGAVEVRLRRQLALAISALSRQHTQRGTPDAAEPIVDNPGTIDALPSQSQIGEDGFVELGTSAKMTLGARRFSAMVEVYGRSTRYAVLYRDPIVPLPDSDLRGGGRITVDAWVSQRVRLFVSYDVSSALDSAPDINGYKSLRMMVSGNY